MLPGAQVSTVVRMAAGQASIGWAVLGPCFLQESSEGPGFWSKA